MNLLSLPEETQLEIFKFVRARDVMNTYEAFDKEPSYKFLKRIAEINYLPYGDSFDNLIYYDEELTLEQRVEHCVTTNNVLSFKRLYPFCNGSQCITLLIDDRGNNDSEDDDYTYMVRPKIARIILERNIVGKNYYDEDLLCIAINHSDVEMFEKYVNKGNIPSVGDFDSQVIRKESAFEMFKICTKYVKDKEFWTLIIRKGIELNSVNIVKLAIDMGGDYNNIGVYTDTSKEILHLLVEYEWNDHILNHALLVNDDYTIDKILAKRPNILDQALIYKNNSALLNYMVKKNLITRIEAYILTDHAPTLTNLLENKKESLVASNSKSTINIGTILCNALKNDDMDTVLQIVKHPKVDPYVLLVKHGKYKYLLLKLFHVYVKENIKDKDYCYKELIRVDGNIDRALEFAKLIGDDNISEEILTKGIKNLSNPFNRSRINTKCEQQKSTVHMLPLKPTLPKSPFERKYRQYSLTSNPSDKK